MIYEDFAIAEHRDLQTIAFDDPRSMCGCKVAPTAKVGNLGFLKSLALLDTRQGCSRLSTNEFSGCGRLILVFWLTYLSWLVYRTQIATPYLIPHSTSTCSTQIYYPLTTFFTPTHS